MSAENTDTSIEAPADGVETAPAKDLPAAARRALAEAEERRRAKAQESAERPKEINGRDGPEPVRYGDWEVNGIASDF